MNDRDLRTSAAQEPRHASDEPAVTDEPLDPVTNVDLLHGGSGWTDSPEPTVDVAAGDPAEALGAGAGALGGAAIGGVVAGPPGAVVGGLAGAAAGAVAGEAAERDDVGGAGLEPADPAGRVERRTGIDAG